MQTKFFVANFGAIGLTIHGQLYNSNMTTNGAAITSGIAGNQHGDYAYTHTAVPDDFTGAFVLYESDNPINHVVFSISPEEGENSHLILDVIDDIPALVEEMRDILQDDHTTPYDGGSKPPTADEALVIVRDDTYLATLPVAGIPANWDVVYWTLKRHQEDEDDEALAQVKVTNGGDAGDGLQVLAGATAANQGWGSLVVDQPNETVDLVLSDEATGALLVEEPMFYSVKVIEDDSTSFTRLEGQARVVYGVTRAIS